MPREHYLVTINRPRSTPIGEMADYINEAVTVWGGQLHPEDPLFDSDAKRVKVTRLTEKRMKRLFKKPELKFRALNLPRECPPGTYTGEIVSMKPLKDKPGSFQLKFKNVKPVENK